MKRLTVAAIIAVMAAGVFTGCGNRGTAQMNSATANTAESRNSAAADSAQSDDHDDQNAAGTADQTGSNSGTQDIGEDAALQAALEAAGISEADASRVRVSMDRDDGRLVYDVEFFFDGTEYDYEIDAEDGRILSLDRDAERYDKRFFDDKDGFLSRDGALEIALLDAGLGRKDISREKIELERDDGFVSYEIEFRSNEGRSFEYVVGAASYDDG